MAKHRLDVDARLAGLLKQSGSAATVEQSKRVVCEKGSVISLEHDDLSDSNAPLRMAEDQGLAEFPTLHSRKFFAGSSRPCCAAVTVV
jgi:hypothetical protein